MNPADFASRWNQSPVIKYKLSSPLCKGLSEASEAFLRESGLPQNAEPWLSFMEIVMTDPDTSSVLEERGLFPVGCLTNGSLICLDKTSDKLIIFDKNDPDELWMLNSSLHALFESLLIYDEFINEVNFRNPDYSSNFKIPDGMLGELRKKLTACDAEAMSNHGFWYCELNALDDSTL